MRARNRREREREKEKKSCCNCPTAHWDWKWLLIWSVIQTCLLYGQSCSYISHCRAESSIFIISFIKQSLIAVISGSTDLVWPYHDCALFFFSLSLSRSFLVILLASIQIQTIASVIVYTWSGMVIGHWLTILNRTLTSMTFISLELCCSDRTHQWVLSYSPNLFSSIQHRSTDHPPKYHK